MRRLFVHHAKARGNAANRFRWQDEYRVWHLDGQTLNGVSHGGALGAMWCRLAALPADRPGSLRFGSAPVPVVGPARGRVRLVGLNDSRHPAGIGGSE